MASFLCDLSVWRKCFIVKNDKKNIGWPYDYSKAILFEEIYVKIFRSAESCGR